MTRTATDIANMACDFLDLDPIGNIETDRSGMGRALQRNYDEAVDTVIREFSWNCATVRASLSSMTLPSHFASDATDHQIAYPWPSECLGIIDINGRPIIEVTHAVETIAAYDGSGTLLSRQHVILCDIVSPIIVRFKARISPADMDPHLAKAAAIELAIRCVMKATNSTQKMDMLETMYRKTTRGDVGRIGGHQVSSRENNAKPPRRYPSTGARARAGDI